MTQTFVTRQTTAKRPVLYRALGFVACMLAAVPVVTGGASAPVFAAALYENETGLPVPPPHLSELETLPKLDMAISSNTGMPIDIREQAMREAALSYGARGGLAWRTYQIRADLDARATSLDKVFNFNNILIAAPSGLLIEPPVISESVNAMIIDGGGTVAAVADRVYDIIANAKITSAPRSWRNYLERDWGIVSPPPDILRPATPEERARWIALVREGWDKGVQQADEIFQDDLNELVSDYQGMVRYRMLLAQGMVTPPYALQTDRGVSGGGDNLRVGDRQVQITGMPALVKGSETWQPASR